MHIALILAGIYVAGAIGMWFWDAYIGIDNDDDNPNNRMSMPAVCFC
jgi:hypothetical protein